MTPLNSSHLLNQHFMPISMLHAYISHLIVLAALGATSCTLGVSRNLDLNLDPATAFGKSLNFSLNLRSPKLGGGGL